MAISAKSKILASDVTTALDKKIDTAGTGLSKSGTTLALTSLHSANATIGASSAGTLAYSGTFTMPYITRDIYGRITGGGTRTLTMPAKPSSGISMSASTIKKLSVSGTTATLPAGGTWFYFLYDGGDSSHFTSGTGAGGSTVNHSDNDDLYGAFALRIA